MSSAYWIGPFGLAFALVLGAAASTQDVLAPAAAMVLENVPHVKASVSAQVAKYSNFKPASLAK